MPNPLEIAGAKGVGKAKGAFASLTGTTGVFTTLVQQHGEVSALLTRAKMSSDAAKRIDLWSKIRVELLSHERAELRVVYPALRGHAQTRAFAEEHDLQASQLEQTIYELDGLDAASDVWADRLEGLITLVNHHIETEEKRYFPVAIDAIAKEEAERLDHEFQAQKALAMDEVALNRGGGPGVHIH